MIKYVFYLLLLISVLDACKRTPKGNTLPPAKSDTIASTQIEWMEPIEKELGELAINKETEVSWRFKNTGNQPLVIKNVRAECGCTVPETPQEPFLPGQEGSIRVKFTGNSAGPALKKVYVTANTRPQSEHTLSFTAVVIGNQ